MKQIHSLLLCFSFIIFGACEKNESLDNQVKVESLVESETISLPTHNNALVKKPQSDWFSNLLQNWELDQNAISNSTFILKKKESSSRTYAVIANLKQGAKVGMVFDYPSSKGQSNATFPRKRITDWNSYGTFFAVANSLYFNANQNPTQLPFPLKQNNEIYSLGNGGSSTDRNRQKYTLNIYDSEKYAEIARLGSTTIDYSRMAAKSYVGFHGSQGNSPGSSVGRTLVGVKDADNDGKCELVILLVASKKTQQQAYKILTDEFLCDDVITYDGGGSSQLICPKINSNPIISGDGRKFPVAIVIKE